MHTLLAAGPALATSSLAIATGLAGAVVLTVWLESKTALRHLGAALIVIIVGAFASNLGVLPSGAGGEEVPVYAGVFRIIAPLSIFWLLLGVDLRRVLAAGRPILIAFFLGVLGTTLGVLLVLPLVKTSLGADAPAVAGMFVGTYTGGSVNFNAVALHYGIVERAGLYAGAVAADNIITAVWMVACLAIPRVLASRWPTEEITAPVGADAEAVLAAMEDRETVEPGDVATLVGLGLGTILAAESLAVASGLPSILIVTIIALGLAQIPAVARVPGAAVLGMFSVYVFLAVIGAYCDLGALVELGALGPRLLLLASGAVLVHALVTFGGARLFGVDPVTASVASQANVGGATTSLAVARSLGRADLVLPAILVGSLGTAVGTFVGFFVAETLLGL